MSDTHEPIPPLSLLFGYGPVLLILALGAAGWLLPVNLQPLAVASGWLWAAAILLFLAGVTRGLSFFSPGGPHRAQVTQMLWLFLLGLVALALGAVGFPIWIPFVLLTIGYASIALFDPVAARADLAPGYFARLRPPQMAIAIFGLVVLLVRALSR